MKGLVLVAGALSVALLARAGGPASAVTGCGYSAAQRPVQLLGSAVGDLDGDGRPEDVSVQASRARPAPCRWLLVVRQGTRVRTWRLPVPYAQSVARGDAGPASLVGLAGIARGRGLEAIVDSGCCGAYVTGQWLLRETSAGIRLLHVRPPTGVPGNAFGNGASTCCGLTPVCGSRRGIVLVFGLGAGVKPVDDADIYVQRGDTFFREGRQPRRRPHDAGDFSNCRPFIRAHG